MNKIEKKVEYITNAVIISIFIIAFISYIAVTIYQIRVPENQQYTFNVVGITGPENATSLTSLHYECVKWCTVAPMINDGQRLRDCWNQCANLGNLTYQTGYGCKQ